MAGVVISNSPVSASERTDSTDVAFAVDSCYPEVKIHTVPVPVNICLNSMNAENDSCVAVSIDGRELFGVTLHFTRSFIGIWSYTDMEISDSSGISPRIRIELVNDPEGILTHAYVFPEDAGDSLRLLTDVHIENDRSVVPDAKMTVNLGISRTAYYCQPEKPHEVVGQYMYNFPLGHRRDPVLNHPELSMFHCGKSVRMPTSQSLENRAQLYLYWHCQKLAELEFDDPDEIERTLSAINRMSRKKEQKIKKKKKKPLITFKSLR